VLTLGEVQGGNQGDRVGVHQELRIGQQLVHPTGVGGVLHGVAQQVGLGQIPPPHPLHDRDGGQQPLQHVAGHRDLFAVTPVAEVIGQTLMEQPIQRRAVGVGASTQVEPQRVELLGDLLDRRCHRLPGEGRRDCRQHAAGDTRAPGVGQDGQDRSSPPR